VDVELLMNKPKGDAVAEILTKQRSIILKREESVLHGILEEARNEVGNESSKSKVRGVGGGGNKRRPSRLLKKQASVVVKAGLGRAYSGISDLDTLMRVLNWDSPAIENDDDDEDVGDGNKTETKTDATSTTPEDDDKEVRSCLCLFIHSPCIY
jgi:hypothetical protein